MKPGKNDVKVNVLIQGDELDALHEITGAFCECFGLESRIFNYKGIRPLGLYSWDFDCLIAGIDSEVKRADAHKWLSEKQIKALSALLVRLEKLDAEHFPIGQT